MQKGFAQLLRVNVQVFTAVVVKTVPRYHQHHEHQDAIKISPGQPDTIVKSIGTPAESICITVGCTYSINHISKCV